MRSLAPFRFNYLNSDFDNDMCVILDEVLTDLDIIWLDRSSLDNFRIELKKRGGQP